MDFEEEPFVFDRSNSFPQDRAYPSRSKRSQIPKRPTGDSLLSDRHALRGGTNEFEPRRRLRYTVPLRPKSNTPRDEEKGYFEDRPRGFGYSTPLAERKTSRGSAPLPPPEFLEIISTKWVPDDEGREIVTLTIKEGEGNPDQEKVRCESRWKHIRSDAMTMKQFYRQVTETPGLGDDDIALVARLLNKVQNTSERKFVHGRYLRPITMVYDGENPDISAAPGTEERHIRKTATFVSLPIFTMGCPVRHTSSKDFEGHPVRALLQSRYRLESTKRRDKEQVITKTTSIKDHLANEDHVVHVPQIWVLIINNYTIITCAALDASILRGETIKLVSYTAAQSDEATWSVHFTDAQGNDFYLPLRFCKTWFDLVRQITDNCLNDEYSFIRDQLLKGGPVYSLVVARDGSPVDAEKWPKLVEEKKTEVIHLRLVDKENVSSRLLFTYCDDQGNEFIPDSEDSSDPSSIFSSDDEESSDASESTVSSDASLDQVTPTVDRLRRLQARLREAEGRGNAKRIEYLKEHKIPVLEEKLLELAGAGLHADAPTARQVPRRTKLVMPGPHVQWPRSSGGHDHDSPLSPTDRHRVRLRSRSRSTSSSRLVTRDVAFSSSAHDLPLNESSARGRVGQQRLIYERNHSGSRTQYFRDVDYGAAPPVRSRIRSHMPAAHTLSRTSTLSAHSHSGWDVLKSRMRDGQVPGLRRRLTSPPISPLTDNNEIYYRPSEKQLARSYWDLVRTSVLEGGFHKLRNADGTKEDGESANQARASAAIALDAQKKEAYHSSRLSDVLGGPRDGSPITLPTTFRLPASLEAPNDPQSPAGGISSISQSDNDPTKPKKVLFSKPGFESKPKLKRLIKLAQKESAGLLKITTSQPTPELSSPIAAGSMIDLPIFLWSAEHEHSGSRDVVQTPSQPPNISEPTTFKSFLQKPTEEIKQLINTSKTEELILHTVLKEIHVTLKKPKKGKPEYAELYEKTANKTWADVSSLMNTVKNAQIGVTKGAAVESNASHPVSQSRRPSLALAGASMRRMISNRTGGSTSGQDFSGSVKLGIFDHAKKILFAFVPKGYDAPVISKYWGALHKLLNEKVEPPDFFTELCNNL